MTERIYQKYDVMPIGEDDECYIIEGHDHTAGWKLALWIMDSCGYTVDEIDMLDPPVRVWLQETYLEPDDEEYLLDEGPMYTLCAQTDEGAKPYTAVTYGWQRWQDAASD